MRLGPIARSGPRDRTRLVGVEAKQNGAEKPAPSADLYDRPSVTSAGSRPPAALRVYSASADHPAQELGARIGLEARARAGVRKFTQLSLLIVVVLECRRLVD